VPQDAWPQDLIDFAGRLADAARAIILSHFRSGLGFEDKPDATPVTLADRAAETRLREMIEASYPSHGVIGEEFGRHQADAEFVWSLDPIDGTKPFITGRPLFGTLIALLQDGRPRLGVIDAPALDERWCGAQGYPTRFTDRNGSRDVRVRPCASLAQAILLNTSPRMFEGAALTAFETLRDRSKFAIYGGDCYCYGQLASGFADLVVEADMDVYDFLALAPVVEGAGGLATDWRGRPIDLASDGRLLCAGDAAVHRQALEILARA
jgi:histidinol phosphatase-like enzyme (inositol monophosphatase family)